MLGKIRKFNSLTKCQEKIYTWKKFSCHFKQLMRWRIVVCCHYRSKMTQAKTHFMWHLLLFKLSPVQYYALISHLLRVKQRERDLYVQQKETIVILRPGGKWNKISFTSLTNTKLWERLSLSSYHLHKVKSNFKSLCNIWNTVSLYNKKRQLTSLSSLTAVVWHEQQQQQQQLEALLDLGVSLQVKTKLRPFALIWSCFSQLCIVYSS